MSVRWTIFCAMIDNFGDIGVCWRLARQLRREFGIELDLWVDDQTAAARFLAAQAEAVHIAGVSVRHWPRPWPEADVVSTPLNQHIAASQCVIEAFGCELPESVKLAMAQRQTPPLWINLEYLSAETWVPGCHGLPSPHNYSPLLKKYFFFPGFNLPDADATKKQTGGLLREAGLCERHAAWQDMPLQSRSQLLATLLPDSADKLATASFDLLVSVFSYETPSFASWLSALTEGSDSVLCLVPEGRSLQPLTQFFGTALTAPGSVYQHGQLTVLVLPFMSQDNYDQLLSVCDFNLVRGEDSFVRAQWAAKPFMWHIYPQDDGVHINKLQAFADCYLQGLAGPSADAWLRFAKGWNLGEDCREMWHYLRPQLPDLLLHSREWQKKLAVMPDLATNLVNFETLFKLSAHP